MSPKRAHFNWSGCSLPVSTSIDVNLLPVAARFRAGVGQQLAVGARREIGQRDRAVLATTCWDRSARGPRRRNVSATYSTAWFCRPSFFEIEVLAGLFGRGAE